MKKDITVIIAEDHALLREKYSENLARHNIQTIGQASNGVETLELLRKNKPDVVLLDLQMPIMDGNMTMTKIMELYPETKVIILSFYYSELLVNEYMDRGAKGYVPKQKGLDENFIDGIKDVSEGGIYIVKVENEVTEIIRSYTKKQIEIIPMICEGFTNKEIAAVVGVSERAIEKQKQKLFFKTGSDNITSFLKFAFKQGFDYLNGKSIQ